MVPAAAQQHEHNEPIMAIGVFAQKVGLSESALRKYEREGLIVAHRTDGGYRLFSLEDVDRVRNIQHLLQDLGLNIEGIRRLQAMLPCWGMLPCNAKVRGDCPAATDRQHPCWMIKGLPCAPKGNECRQCPVYRFGSLCAQDIKHLLNDPGADDANGRGSRIRERMEHLHRQRWQTSAEDVAAAAESDRPQES